MARTQIGNGRRTSHKRYDLEIKGRKEKKEGKRKKKKRERKKKGGEEEDYHKHDKLYITLGAKAAVSEAKAIGKGDGLLGIYEGYNSGQMELSTHFREEERAQDHSRILETGL